MKRLFLLPIFLLLSGMLLADPTASPVAGTYSGAISVMLNDATPGATICWRNDGTNPAATTPGACDAGSNTFSGSISVTSSTTIVALATKSGFSNSNIVSFAYVITTSTWYVSSTIGGPRISPNNPGVASCTGHGQSTFNSSGAPGQNCPFQSGVWLWNDPYTYNVEQWVIQGGDTVIFLDVGASHPNQFSGSTGAYGVGCWGIGSNCSPPPVPSGTSGQHTILKGVNGGSCSTTDAYGTTIMDPAKGSFLWAGGGTGQLFNLDGSRFVDISCMQIRSHSSCNHINLGCDGTEWAGRGIWTGSTANSGDITLTDMQITGFQSRGIIGNITGNWTLNNVEISFNGSAGWDLDPGTGSTRDSVNAVVVENNNIISWNGCTREWPEVHAVPVAANGCTDQGSAGYGDGIGTPPTFGFLSWTLNHSRLAYNTQDAIDLGHLLSGTVIYKNNILFGNEGGAMKVGNAASLTYVNNFSEANCTRMAQPIAGADPSYNSQLNTFCRAGGDQNTFNYDPTLGHRLDADVEFNTFVGTGATVLDAQCFSGPCIVGTTGNTYTFKFSNNVVIGYDNAINSPAPTYPSNAGQKPGMWNNLFPTTENKNLFYNLRSCPAVSTDISPACTLSPAFVGQPAFPITAESVLDNYNFYPTPGSPLIHAGVYNSAVPLDYYGATRPNPPTIGAAEPTGSVTLTSIAVTPNPATISTTSPFGMTCTSTYSDTSTGPCVSPVWTDTGTHSSINSSTGVVTGSSVGADTVTATIGSISGNATVNITAPTLSTITVRPSTATLTVGGTLNYSTASFCTYTDSSTVPTGSPGCLVVWSDTNTHSSINSSTGLATGLSAGSDTITATLSPASPATATLSVAVGGSTFSGTGAVKGVVTVP